jgi:hypothetical protein
MKAEWRWLKVPRVQSCPDRRTGKPSVSSDPKASASAVAQSKPSPVSNICFLASSCRATVLWMSKPSGARVRAAPTSFMRFGP